MDQLSARLATLLGMPVADATGLKGGFDFSFQWSPEDMHPEGQAIAEGPSLFTALEQQAGLRLEPRKVSADVLVIDHAEPLSSN